MIQSTDTVKTGDGRKVRIAFIENDIVHGFMETNFKNPERGVNPPNMFNPEWTMGHWHAESGDPMWMGLAWREADMLMYEANILHVVKPTKRFSHTLYVLKSGAISSFFSSSEYSPDDVFAELTINAEVEEGSSRVVSV